MFDHGAPFFTASNNEVLGLVHEWESRGLVAEWKGNFGSFDCISRKFIDVEQVNYLLVLHLCFMWVYFKQPHLVMLSKPFLIFVVSYPLAGPELFLIKISQLSLIYSQGGLCFMISIKLLLIFFVDLFFKLCRYVLRKFIMLHGVCFQ